MPGDLRGARGLQPVGLVKSRHLKTHLPGLISLRRMEREWRGQLCDEPARMGERKAEPGVHQGLHGSASEEGTAAPRDEPSPPTCGDCPQDEAAGGTEGELVDRTLEKPHLRCAGSVLGQRSSLGSWRSRWPFLSPALTHAPPGPSWRPPPPFTQGPLRTPEPFSRIICFV